MRMNRYLAIACAALLLTTGGAAQPGPPPRPKLVVAVSIDQLRFEVLERFIPLYRGGLRMMVDRAAIFANAHYRHAATETGPGHSVLLSGTHPSHSGIVANEWYDAYLRRAMNVVDDPAQTTVGGRGRAASPANFLGFTVGDVLKRDVAGARVVGVSAKDRSAILLGGRRADGAYWFENAGGNFITSTYYVNTPPQWLTDWNRLRIPDRFSGQTWNRLVNDAGLYEKYAGKDAVAAERDGKDITFPHHVLAKPPTEAYYAELRRTPFVDEIILDFALEAMKQHGLGSDAATDILAIGFSGNDGIGHAFGLESQEAMDQLLRLDRQLERLFTHIDKTVGLDQTIVVLSADHGSRPMVELSQARGIAARRVAPAVLEKAVAGAFAKRYPSIKGLVSYFAVDFYLDKDVIRQHDLDMKDVEKTAIDALMATGAVERVYTQDELRSIGRSTDPFLTLYQNAFFEPRSPHLNVLLKRDVYMTASAFGSGHGSAYEFDRHVPVVFMGRNIKPGRYTAAAGPEDIAPSLAHLLRLEYPREWDSRLLTEMLQGSK